MELRFFAILSGTVLLLALQTAPSFAEDKIQAFVNPNGRRVYTNLVENTPPASVTPEKIAIPGDETPESLRTLVDTISLNHGVDAGLVRAVIKAESNFNPWAVSNKGAMGLMQLIPATGRRYGVRDFFDPQQNVDGGVRYLKFLLEKFNGDLDLSLAAYNAGENLVARLGRIPPIAETTDYVRKVRAIYKKPSPVLVTPAAALVAAVQTAAKPESATIYKLVDERGVVHFSNVEPPN